MISWQFSVIECTLPVLCDGCLLFLSVAKITDLLKANRSAAKDSTCGGFSGHLRGCIACRDGSMGSETRRRCWWIPGSFWLGAMQAEIQEFMFMHKALPIFGFYCRSASVFCNFWGRKEIRQEEIRSYELMIVRVEQFPGIKEVLVGFQSISGRLSSAGWLQSLLHQTVLLDYCYCSGGFHCQPDLSS